MTHLYQATGLGIKSTNPKHWLPNPAKSVIMSKAQLRSFMGSGSTAKAMQPSSTSSVPQPSTTAWGISGFSVTSKP